MVDKLRAEKYPVQTVLRLESVDREAASILRPLIDEIAEARFRSPSPDEDVAGMLTSAADELVNLEDTANTLLAAANQLAHLEDTAGALNEAANKLANIEDAAATLQNAALRISGLDM